MRLVACACLLLLSSAAFAQHGHAPASSAPVALLEGTGRVDHPVTTQNAEAQKFFNQGMGLLYGFNHDEAARSFQRAAALDPKLAMAWWGIALVHGRNYNMPAMEDRQKAAYEALQQARARIQHASEAERDYINALSARYTADPKADANVLEKNYSAAMRELMKKYPDDLDAATLYAESLMNLRPWELWSADGKPAPETAEIVAVLESVMRRDPHHTGANHYFIHAIEASPAPERGLAAANRLASLAPGIGHLVHMPSHIYLRTGDYDAAATTNLKAADADRAYLNRSKAEGVYPMMYFSHNMHFEALSHMLAGRRAEALRAAQQLEEHLSPMAAKKMPMLEQFLVTRPQVLVAFQRWDDVLAMQAPDADLHFMRGYHHFARGMAQAAKGNAEASQRELAELKKVRAGTPADAILAQNPMQLLLGIGEDVLGARIARARKQYGEAEAMLQRAMKTHDGLKYIEPPEWPTSVREELATLYYAQGKYADAEKVFRLDLEKNPRSGRSLFGLAQALKAQKKMDSAREIERQYQVAWSGADAPLTAAWLGVKAEAVAAERK